ncbi:MAG: HNH endonuclease [Proteobacteria bacterium]|uniref:HNH endonuclease n=1 Tax=Rudaea sp. TaxID=2136325 RepID=UPI0032204FE8|nr:HNH endonuclease [Pseudomonadota bacterium]
MERLLPATDLPYEIGALYSRRNDIHARLGGQQQGGISTPATSPFVILFTGEAGQQHGYHDFWDDQGILHYYGEGQRGDMQDRGGNRAIREHLLNNKRLLLFQMMGHGQPYRFLGEFRYIFSYEQPGVPDTTGNLRTALVFKLEPVQDDFAPFQHSIADKALPEVTLAETTTRQLVEIRAKQTLFKRRLLTVEKACRITGIADLRFLRASHIKPWSRCASGQERVDGNNGLLLTPAADFLFDRGWISFENSGRLLTAGDLPSEVSRRIGLRLSAGRSCGHFFDEQKAYLEYHRNAVFERGWKNSADPLAELLSVTT